MDIRDENGDGEACVSKLWDQVVRRREILDMCADKNWLIPTGEIARIIGLKPVAITSRGDSFEHETWVFERRKREGNNYVWSVRRINTQTPRTLPEPLHHPEA